MQVKDTYSSSLAIDFRSVKVKTYPEGRENLVTYDYTGNVGTFIIPDNTHVIINYDARISEPPGEDTDFVPFSNTVDVSGLSASVVDSSEIKVKSNGDAITPEIFVYKYRNNHMEQGLNGAVFKLYEALTDENGNEVLDSNGNRTYLPIKVHDQDFTITSSYDPDTKKNGQIHLKLDLQEHGFNLLANKYYYIHEETPPTGYIASDVYYQFKIRTDGKVNYSQREYLLGDTLTVRNAPDSVDLHLVKTIKGNVRLTDDDLTLLNFKLEKLNEETGLWEIYDNKGNINYTQFKNPSDYSSEDDSDPDNPTQDNPTQDNPDPDNPTQDNPTQDGENQQNNNEPQETTVKFVVKNLGRGKYRITETGNSDILDNHAGAKAYVMYEIDDNSSGTTAVAEFEITRDFLDKDQDRTVTFTNTFSKDTVDRKAVKKWYDVNNQEINWPKGVQIQLDVVTLDNGVAGTTPVKSIVLDGKADDEGELIAGTASFTGLPKYKEDGTTAQQYAVRESTELIGYDQDKTFYELPNSNAVTIKNTKRSTSLSMTKKWLGAVPQNATATICLWGYSQEEKKSDAKVLSTLEVTPTQNCESVTQVTGGEEWVIKFENVPVTNDSDVPLNYFFTEISCSPGYEPSYPSNGMSAPVDGVITNAVAKTSFAVTKQWRNTAENLWPDGKVISLTVGRKKAGSTQADTFSIPCTMTATGCQPTGTLPGGAAISFTDKGSGKYSLEITGLDKYASDGTLWNYYVTESKLDGFKAIYEDETHNDVTDKLKHAPNGGYIFNTGEVYSLTVSKKVTGNFGDTRYYFTYTVKMADKDNAPFEGTLNYKKTGAWSGDVEGSLTFTGGTATFTLCHNESITIPKVPVTMTYSVTEERSGARGYTVQSSVNGTPSKKGDSQYFWYGPLRDADGIPLDDQRISYVNDRSRLIPTGVEMQIGSSVVLFLLFTLGLAFMMIRRRSESDSE